MFMFKCLFKVCKPVPCPASICFKICRHLWTPLWRLILFLWTQKWGWADNLQSWPKAWKVFEKVTKLMCNSMTIHSIECFKKRTSDMESVRFKGLNVFKHIWIFPAVFMLLRPLYWYDALGVVVHIWASQWRGKEGTGGCQTTCRTWEKMMVIHKSTKHMQLWFNSTCGPFPPHPHFALALADILLANWKAPVSSLSKLQFNYFFYM